MSKYILNGHEAVIEPGLITWAKWYEKANRHVGKDVINGATVSTVFLSIDHAFDEGKPMLFETMVFGGPLDESCERCSTWEEAEAMHKKWCDLARKAT